MTGDTHKNHVGIGITRYTRRVFKKDAARLDLSMRQYLERIAREIKSGNIVVPE